MSTPAEKANQRHRIAWWLPAKRILPAFQKATKICGTSRLIKDLQLPKGKQENVTMHYLLSYSRLVQNTQSDSGGVEETTTVTEQSSRLEIG
jgi:hypothetical protein